MKRYVHRSNFSVIAALGAAFATAATVSVTVMLPAKTDGGQELLARSAPAAAEQTVAVIPPIEVVGYRTERAVSQTAPAKRAALSTVTAPAAIAAEQCDGAPTRT